MVFIFRMGLPVNYLKHVGHVNKDIKSTEKDTIINKVKHLMQKMIEFVDVDQAADKLGRRFIYDSMPPVLSKVEVKYTSKYDGDYMQNGKVYNRYIILSDCYIKLNFDKQSFHHKVIIFRRKKRLDII